MLLKAWKKVGLVWVTSLLTIFMHGCLLDEKDDTKPSGYNSGITVTACGDNLSAEKQVVADSLVNEGQEYLGRDIRYLAGGDIEHWDHVYGRNFRRAEGYFNQALQIAPQHCGAQFGKAITHMMATLNEKELDDFVKSVNEESGNEFSVENTAQLLKITPEAAPQTLMKLQASLNSVEKPVITRMQDLIGNSILPRLDSAIAFLDAVNQFENFFFDFEIDNEMIRIDRAEVGGGLAGLKVARAYLTVIAGYNAEFAKDGNYEWMYTLTEMYPEDFDNLSAEQKAALDHVTGFFTPQSSITKIRSGWENKIHSIPEQLLDAVNTAQEGLRVLKSRTNDPEGQAKYLYSVGVTERDDVDPSDLDLGIELMEKSKKYLTGEVNISYANGSRNLKVNFPALFKINGIQKFLPYYKLLPYDQWNDTLRVDDVYWENISAHSYMPWETQVEIEKKLGFSRSDYDINIRGKNGYYYYPDTAQNSSKIDTFIVETWDQVLGQVWFENNNSCTVSYHLSFDRQRKEQPTAFFADFLEFESIPKESSGQFELQHCRVTDNGLEGLSDVDYEQKIPFYFTDAQGNQTMTIEELEKMDFDTLAQLRNRIIFPDPTFGGVFPELTQDNIWETLKSLEGEEPNVRVCEVNDYGWQEDCHYRLPENHSDLDLFIYTVFKLGPFMDNLFNPDMDFEEF